jgi:HTH-type transcriptional regulator/antitoxin HigA
MRKILDFTRPHLLRDEAEYDAAVREIEELLDEDPAPGSEDCDRLEFLSVLVEAYEDRIEPLGEVSPQDAVEFMLEQRGLARAELTEVMGGRSRVSEFFAGKRDLSKAQIEALHRTLGIPVDVLLGLRSTARVG